MFLCSTLLNVVVVVRTIKITDIVGLFVTVVTVIIINVDVLVCIIVGKGVEVISSDSTITFICFFILVAVVSFDMDIGHISIVGTGDMKVIKWVV